MSGARGRTRRRVAVGTADLSPGQRRLVTVEGRQVGIFNVNGRYVALHNRCPHMGGNLCQGPVTGTTLPTDQSLFEYGREGEIIRCAWHGWEFDLLTGGCLVDDRLRVRTYPVEIHDGQLVILI